MTNHEINSLIKKIAQGDIDAFENLYVGMKIPVYFYALNLSNNPNIAEDAMQDTFISIMRNCRSYISKGNSQTWIFTIVRNKVLDQLKKQKPTCSIDEIENQAQFSYQIDNYFEDNDVFIEMLRPLNKRA